MKAISSFNVQFITRTGKNQKENSLVYVRISVNGKRTEISLKKTIETSSWNSLKECVKGTKPDARSTNNFIEQVRYRLMECYQHLQLGDGLVTLEAVKNMFLGISPEEQTLCSLITYHNTNMKEILAEGTLKNYFTTEKYVKLFLTGKMRKTDLPLSLVNYQFIIEFELFLRRHKPLDHQKPLDNNGVMKHLERLRKIVRLAVKMEWMEKDPFARYKMKFKKVDRSYLTPEELSFIENKSFSLPRMQVVKDLFVFSCYTGLAYIDVMNLTPSGICMGVDNTKWIRTFREKTDTPVNVPLLSKALAILEKYSGDPKAAAKGTIFPTLSNQKLNSYLKEVADICGINKNLTFHLARHTFATTVTLSNGVPIETVSKMLGHTKISTTQIYARVVEQKIGKDMDVLKAKLNGNDGSPSIGAA